MTVIEIDTMRRAQGLSVTRLCQTANISTRAYHRALKGERAARADTLAKLAGALDACRRAPTGAALKVSHTKLIFRTLLVLVADAQGISPDAVLKHDPQLKATSNDGWMQITRTRNFVAYLMKSVAGLSNAEVARAAGVTQAAMTIAIQNIENRRDDQELDRLYRLFEQVVTGACQ